jgi:hypothetical protein
VDIEVEIQFSPFNEIESGEGENRTWSMEVFGKTTGGLTRMICEEEEEEEKDEEEEDF